MIEDLPWRIRQLRMARGWRKADLAAECGVARSTVTRWERGGQRPNLQDLWMLADVFELTLDVLVKGR